MRTKMGLRGGFKTHHWRQMGGHAFAALDPTLRGIVQSITESEYLSARWKVSTVDAGQVSKGRDLRVTGSHTVREGQVLLVRVSPPLAEAFVNLMGVDIELGDGEGRRTVGVVRLERGRSGAREGRDGREAQGESRES
jgi:hypothetical protein